MKILVTVVCACYLTAAVSTSEDVISVSRNIGEDLPLSVDTRYQALNLITCYLLTPDGSTVRFRPNQDGSASKYRLRPYNALNGCSVDARITGPEDQGLWQLHAHLPNGVSTVSSYRVSVNGAPEELTTMPPAVTERYVINMEQQSYNTTIGATANVSMSRISFSTPETCHVVSPDGVTYTMTEEFSQPQIEFVVDNNVACGVNVQVTTEEMIGEWMLISREIRFSEPIEKRLPFTIHVEEIVDASPQKVTVVENNDMYVRLAKAPGDLQSTCKLIAVGSNENITYEQDLRYQTFCGYIVRNVTTDYSGNWEIVYGTKIIYRAPIEVNVIGSPQHDLFNLTWVLGRPVNEVLGSENATYCRVQAPDSSVVSDGIGRCYINFDRADSSFAGTWTLNVGVPGRILPEVLNITVNVVNQEPKPAVVTHVEKYRPLVYLTCSLPEGHQVQACHFREPAGRVLMAVGGVGEDRYTSSGTNVQLESSVNGTSCGLRIMNPVVEDLGLWRCSMVTSEDVFHGFLSVICPWAMSNPAIAASVETEPVLKATRSSVEGFEGDVQVLSCAIQAPIKYCYFRARNGTVFTVYPELQSEDMEYSGAGFDAGECGVRFQGLAPGDSGSWSCHVGLHNQTAAEQRAAISVNIKELLTVSRLITASGDLVITAQVPYASLEYCRFVRMDGFGFTEANLPSRYSMTVRDSSRCQLLIRGATVLELHPWTVVASVLGRAGEVSATTEHALERPQEPQPPVIQYYRSSYSWVLISLISVSIALMILAVTRKNVSRWSYANTQVLRDSFRFKKTVVIENNNETKSQNPV